MTIQIIIIITLIIAISSLYITSYNYTSYVDNKSLKKFNRHYMFIKSYILYLKLHFLIKVMKKDKYDFLEKSIQRLVNYDITSKRAKSSKIATLEDSIIYLTLQEFLHVNINSEKLWAQLHYKNKEELNKGNFKIYIYDITNLANKENKDDMHKFKKILSFTVKEFKVNNGRKGPENKVINLRKD